MSRQLLRRCRKSWPDPVWPAVARKAAELDAHVAAEVHRSRGAPLDDGTRTRMEAGFGVDLGDVRIHRDSAAAPRINAAAFTIGRDVHFAPGQYSPGTRSGRWLLGHELTHVVQQTGRVSRQPTRTVIRRRGGGKGRGEQGGGRVDAWIDELPEPLRPGVRRLLAAIRSGEITVTPAQARQLRLLLHSLVLVMSGETTEEHEGPVPPNTIAVSLVVSLVLGRNVGALFRGCDVLVLAGPGRGLPAITARTGPDIDTVFHDMVFGPSTGAGSGLGPVPIPTRPPRLLQIETPPVDVEPTVERRPKDIEAYLARYSRAPDLAKNVLEAMGMDIASAERWMGCTLLGWDDGPLAALVGEFNKSGGGVADWTAIATCHPTLANQSGVVAKLAGSGWTAGALVRVLKIGWTADGVQQLVVQFGTDPGGLPAAADWAAIAAAHQALAGNVTDVCTLARSAIAWPGSKLADLAAAFGKDRAGLSAAEWVDIARALKKVDVDAAVAFAGLGWSGPKVKGLVTYYATKAEYRLSADQWVRIARLPRFRDKELDVTLCASVGERWTPEQVVALAAVIDASTNGWPVFQFVGLTLVAAKDDVATVRLFSTVAWTIPQLKSLLASFVLKPAGLSAEQWAEVASGSEVFKNEPDQVTAFLHLDGWSPGARVALAKAFGVAKGGPKSADWIKIATVAGLADDTAAVLAFASIKGWKAPQIAKLIQIYGLGKGHLEAVDWITLAGAHPKLKDAPGDVAEFARIGHGWSVPKLEVLIRAYCLKPGGLGAAGWAKVAAADALKDLDDTVAAFAQTGQGWTGEKLAALALAFTNDPGTLPLVSWVAVARVNRGLKNRDDAVCAFARLANGWTAPNVVILARRFGEHTGALTMVDFCNLAKAHASLNASPEGVAALAEAGWSAANVTACCTNLVAACAVAGTTATLFEIAGTAAAAKAMLDGGWPAADLGTYLGSCLAKGAGTDALAELLAIAETPAATRMMIATRWTVANLGMFTGRALEQQAEAQSLADAMGTVGFALRSFNLINGAAWTAESVGNFCGAALCEGLGVDELFTTIDDPNAPGAIRALPRTDWSDQEIGELTAGARLQGVSAADFRILLNNAPNYPRRHRADEDRRLDGPADRRVLRRGDDRDTDPPEARHARLHRQLRAEQQTLARRRFRRHGGRHHPRRGPRREHLLRRPRHIPRDRRRSRGGVRPERRLDRDADRYDDRLLPDSERGTHR